MNIKHNTNKDFNIKHHQDYSKCSRCHKKLGVKCFINTKHGFSAYCSQECYNYKGFFSKLFIFFTISKYF